MDVKYLRRCEKAKTKMKTNKLALNECFRSSCRNMLILNVLSMVCGAMAGKGGGGGGGVASCMARILIIHMTPLGQRQNSNDLPQK